MILLDVKFLRGLLRTKKEIRQIWFNIFAGADKSEPTDGIER